MAWCFPISLAGLFEAWVESPMVGCGWTLWRLIPFSIICSIWKKRNERIFNGKKYSGEDIVSTVELRITKWVEKSF